MQEDLRKRLTAIHHDEEGAGATEYIILLILIACVIIAIVKVFGTTLRSKYERAQEKVDKDVVIP